MCVVNVLTSCRRQECVCSECVDKLQETRSVCVVNVLTSCRRQECVCSECVDKLQETGVCV